MSWQTDESKKFPGGWGPVDDAESIRAIHAALDAGIDFLDTSESYGCGHSERVIGRAIAGRRDAVVIGTKFGNIIDEEKKLYLGHDAGSDFIRTCCENSLRRLDTDYIDIYYLHWSNYGGELGPVIETLEDLVTQGKIRTYGWSTDDSESMRALAAGEHCSVVEFGLNLVRRNSEMMALCEELNLGGVIRSPLVMGLLTGKYDIDKTFPEDDIRHTWDLSAGRFSEIRQMVEQLRDILTSDGRSVVQGALGWIWSQSDRVVPIPGFRNVEQIKENARAMEFGPLSPTQIQEIEQVLAKGVDDA
ncbi:aldo/keto reductase [Candidatus Bipolaricaulota bacterium]